MRRGVALPLAFALAACGDDAPASSARGGATSSEPATSVGPGAGGASTTGAPDASNASGPATTTTSSGGGGGGPDVAPALSPIDRSLVCKLISDETIDDPTANATHTRFNLRGTDLGVPLVIGDDLHLFFGDTVGYREIWDFGEDPDAVARIPMALAADVTRLCDSIDVHVTTDIPSVAADTDPSILRDFAGAFMSPPPGVPIETFIAQPPPGFPNIPGTFEVPTGALAQGSAAYLFYAGAVDLTPAPHATLSYLARWDAPGTSAPGYQILFEIDRLGGGALGGHFLQIAPVAQGGFLHYFGTGEYRRSGIYLARKPIGALEQAGGEELFDPATATWQLASSMTPAQRSGIPPLLENDGVGELSVTYLPSVGLWLLLHQRELHDGSGLIADNRIVLRAARHPEGPWSEAATLIDMADPAFQAAHCCGPASCPGEQVLHCDRAGLYGAYLLPQIDVAEVPGGLELTLPFLASTWDPYDVVLFRSRVTVTAP